MKHTEAQLDFILEMYAQENPDEYEFVRPGKPKPLSDPEMKQRMESVLLGKARDKFFANMMPSAAVLKRAAEISGSHDILKKAAANKA
jgi:hypothetical protein